LEFKYEMDEGAGLTFQFDALETIGAPQLEPPVKYMSIELPTHVPPE
jgi:hypothetical protein